jgi:hypothetical protein
MRIRQLMSIGIVTALLCACTPKPTSVEIPSNATSVERFSILNGHAFQTQFTLDAVYPATPALEFYRARLGEPWVLCEWSGPQWQNFEDAQQTPRVGVHQLLYMWINREANRTLMLSMRYYSAPSSRIVPDNNAQKVLLVEYLTPDITRSINELNLRCPSG